MSRRISQLNELLKSELALLISRTIPLDNGLITVSYVKCSPDLRYAKIGVSILPDKLSLSAIKRLKKHNREFSEALRKKLSIKFIPKFDWVADYQEKYAAEIEEVLKEINEQK